MKRVLFFVTATILVCIMMTSCGKDQQVKNAKQLLDYYSELSELDEINRSLVYNMAEINKENPDLSIDDVMEKDKPEKIDNYIIVRNKNKDKKDDWFVIAMNINGNTSISSELSDQDLNDLDVIVVAESEYFSENYHNIGNDSGNQISVSAETITMYFFNTKTKTIFGIDYFSESLPETTRNTATHEVSDKEIIEKAKERMGVN